MGDGEEDAVVRAFEGGGAVGGAGRVEDVTARAVLAARVAVAALKDEDLLDAVVPVRRVRAARPDADEDGRITRRRVAPEHAQRHALVPRLAPVDLREVDQGNSEGRRQKA